MLRMRGNLAVLQVGYVESVQIRDWSLTCNQEVVGVVDWQLDGIVAVADSFWSTQPPTEVHAKVDWNIWWGWVNPAITSGKVVKGKPITLMFRGDLDIQLR